MHVQGIHPRAAQVASSHHRLRRQELVITAIPSSPLEVCPQQAKVPWTKLMHEQMIRASKVTAFPERAIRVSGMPFAPSHTGSPSGAGGR